MVARCAAMACINGSGASFSSRTVLARAHSGKHSRPPSPNVNASGGVPMKTSLACGLRQWRGKISHIAMTSR